MKDNFDKYIGNGEYRLHINDFIGLWIEFEGEEKQQVQALVSSMGANKNDESKEGGGT
jgi:hypothetical protein